MEEIDLKDLFEMFWKKKIEVILIVIIFALIGYGYTKYLVVPEYSSSTTLVLASTNSNSKKSDDDTITTTDLTINSKLVETYSVLIKSKSTLGQVINTLGMNVDEEELKKYIDVTAVKGTEVIQITVRNQDAYSAASIANEVAKAFMEKIKDIYNIENIKVVDKAEVEEEPSNVNYKKSILIFAAIGAMVATAYVLILNMLDTTVKTAEEIEKNYKLPVIAVLPIYETTIQKNKKDVNGGVE